MVRKWMIVLVVFAFAVSFLALASCAKKQVKADESAVKPPAAAAAPAGDRAKQLQDLTDAEKARADVKAFESEHIYFDYDKSELKPEARAVLEKKAGWLRANAAFKVNGSMATIIPEQITAPRMGTKGTSGVRKGRA